MAFDSFALAAVKKELAAKLSGGRIERIYQPERETGVFYVRQQGQVFKLLFTTSATSARVQLTSGTYHHPVSPPPFCMVLRKHLEGGKILSFHHPPLERVLSLRIAGQGELGREEKVLVAEIMGKHSNLVLLDAETNTVIDAIKRHTFATNRYREVLPGREYVPPPQPEKVNLLTAREEDFTKALLSQSKSLWLPSALTNCFLGLGPELSKEIVARAGLDPETPLKNCGTYELERLWLACQELLQVYQTDAWQPTLVTSGKEYIAFTAYNPLQYQGMPKIFFTSMSEALDTYYAARLEKEKFQRTFQNLSQTVNQALKRTAKKLGFQEEALATTTKVLEYKTFGELLTANLYQLKGGEESFTTENFYSPQREPVTIPLDPALSPAQNAQSYFQKYRKAKESRLKLLPQIAETKEEIQYLTSILASLKQAEKINELLEIKAELEETGYLEREKKVKGTAGKEKPAFLTVTLANGDQILIGKNNKQNDYLTFKVAQAEDLWLHAKEHPGAHVIIKGASPGKEVSPATLAEAARLAAYYSDAREAKKVAVDITRRKYVRKPPGAKPGFVLYDHHRTLYVSPETSSSLAFLNNKDGTTR